MASLVHLSDEQRELSERARRFVDEVLIPHEVAAERSGGHLPAEVVDGIKEAAVKARLNGGRHSVDHGGQGWSAVDYVLVHEQLGRNTNGLWWWIPDAYNVLSAGTPDQIERYLRALLWRATAMVSYAVTEEHAGSDPSAIRTTARPDGDGWVIDGEKWFVTSGDVAAAHIVVANAEGHGPTLFIVDADRLMGWRPSTIRRSRTPSRMGTPRSGSPECGWGRRRSSAASVRPMRCSSRGSWRSAWASSCTASGP